MPNRSANVSEIPGGLNPYINPYATAPTAGAVTPDVHTRLQGYIRSWFRSTESLRLQMKRDFEYVDAQGKQWNPVDRQAVTSTGRPALEFNQILPQVELLAGIQRDMTADMICRARGRYDKYISEIATASLKATKDFIRLRRINDKVFDDASICGLGAVEIGHSIDDSQDLLWGDITADRVNPLAFIWDPWSANSGNMQDGAYMGKMYWMQLDEFVEKYPKYQHMAVPGEWLASNGLYTGDSSVLGTPEELLHELYDQQTGRIRILQMWWKEEKQIAIVVNVKTGNIVEVPSKSVGQELLNEMARRHGQRSIENLELHATEEETLIADRATGMPAMSPDGQPLQFMLPGQAQAYLDQMSQQAGMAIYDTMNVITRRVRCPYWAEMCWWSILNQGKTPNTDRLYPFVPYTSRKFSDNPESIKGLVRDLRDPQDEYNKRYSNLLGHLNSSTHSGWLNKKVGGANPDELKKVGSKPGVVVEFSQVAPQQIKPVELSQGHVELLNNSERQILRISGLNAEMVGMTTQNTVSGKAIQARQSGGVAIIKPRLRNYEEFLLDESEILLSRIQQYYPVEKIKRIIDVADAANPMGPQGMSLWTDPVTGMSVPDDHIINYLKQVKNITFDLSVKLANEKDTDQDARFERNSQYLSLLTSSGYPIGPNTLMNLLDESGMTQALVNAIKADIQAGMNPAMAQPQAEQLNKITTQSKGRAGSNEGQIGGGRANG